MKNNSGLWERVARKSAVKPVEDQVAYEKKLELAQGYIPCTGWVFFHRLSFSTCERLLRATSRPGSALNTSGNHASRVCLFLPRKAEAL